MRAQGLPAPRWSNSGPPLSVYKNQRKIGEIALISQREQLKKPASIHSKRTSERTSPGT